MKHIPLFTQPEITRIAKKFNTPMYVYSKKFLLDRIAVFKKFNVTMRYAMKANPHRDIIALFNKHGLHFDSSSSYEAQHLLNLGISGKKISLSSQEPAHNLQELINKNVHYTATSLHQLFLYAQTEHTGKSIGIRINPGMGSGEDKRRNTGGKNSSFGIWHEYLSDALTYCAQQKIHVDTLHIHVGSGADPAIWEQVMIRSLQLCAQMPSVTKLNIGGGYKIHRFGTEKETDMHKILKVFFKHLDAFNKKSQRAISLEIEPGTWLVGHAGMLVANVVDIVDTGKNGYSFVKLNTGMNDILRPTLYGSQHMIEVISTEKKTGMYVFVGHNCETGDILTPENGNPNGITPRKVRLPKIGDLVAIYDTGAYCASMRAQGYNAFPSAGEICI
ncbi:MAG: diaminopimelate decarboxylase [Minisyncoccia bacterium]